MTNNEKKADLLECLKLLQKAYLLCNSANIILSKEFEFTAECNYQKHLFYSLWCIQPQHEIYKLEKKIIETYNNINNINL